MKGTKTRSFSPLPDDLSLEDLVPEDHFYRRLEATLDLSFVRKLVAPLYANGGRPSVDPVVFFKLQLVMFFEDLRSERQLMRAVADRLSVRWYLGYDLFEPLPDHSSLTRIRERFGLSIFRRFFERIVEECIEAVGGIVLPQIGSGEGVRFGVCSASGVLEHHGERCGRWSDRRRRPSTKAGRNRRMANETPGVQDPTFE
jgi:transposase